MFRAKINLKINAITNFVKKYSYGKNNDVLCSFFVCVQPQTANLNFQHINVISPLYFAQFTVE